MAEQVITEAGSTHRHARPVEETWSARLRRLRLAKKLSQAQAARKLGISAVSVCQWETGQTKPARNRMGEIARLYGVSLNRLYGMSEKPVSKTGGRQDD